MMGDWDAPLLEHMAMTLAMSDELFMPEVISLESEFDACVCDYRPKRECSEYPSPCEYCEGCNGADCACERGVHGSLTVRQKEKHFRVRRFIEVPTWNEDADFYTENECNIL